MRRCRASQFGAILLWTAILAAVSISVPPVAVAEPEEADSFDMLGQFPTSEAASRIRPYQFRFNGMYGSLHFGSTRSTSTSNFALDGVQAGLRAELERCFHMGPNNQRSLGFIADLQFVYAGTFNQAPGDPVSYISTSAALAYRVLGYGHTVPWSPELTAFLGPAIEFFPAISAYTNFLGGGFGYNLSRPAVFGAKVGARLRFPLFSRYTAIEGTGYYIRPIQMIGGETVGNLDYAKTESFGATALLDVRLGHNLIVGLGYYWGFFKLNFTPPGQTVPDVSTYMTEAYLVSARFNL